MYEKVRAQNFLTAKKLFQTLFFSISLCFVSKRSVNIRFFPKFAQLWRGLSPSSRGVRSSDWMIIKAEVALCRMRVSPLSGFSSEKSYSGSKTHTKPKNAIHTPILMKRMIDKMTKINISRQTLSHLAVISN